MKEDKEPWVKMVDPKGILELVSEEQVGAELCTQKSKSRIMGQIEGSM